MIEITSAEDMQRIVTAWEQLKARAIAAEAPVSVAQPVTFRRSWTEAQIAEGKRAHQAQIDMLAREEKLWRWERFEAKYHG